MLVKLQRHAILVHIQYSHSVQIHAHRALLNVTNSYFFSCVCIIYLYCVLWIFGHSSFLLNETLWYFDTRHYVLLLFLLLHIKIYIFLYRSNSLQFFFFRSPKIWSCCYVIISFHVNKTINHSYRIQLQLYLFNVRRDGTMKWRYII